MRVPIICALLNTSLYMAIKQSFVAFFFLLFEGGIGGASTRLGRRRGCAAKKKFGNC